MNSIQGLAASSTAPSVRPVTLKASVASTGNALQESQETAAQTKAEAAKGDQQAMRKLAKSQAGTKPVEVGPPKSTPTLDGGKVDLVA